MSKRSEKRAAENKRRAIVLRVVTGIAAAMMLALLALTGNLVLSEKGNSLLQSDTAGLEQGNITDTAARVSIVEQTAAIQIQVLEPHAALGFAAGDAAEENGRAGLVFIGENAEQTIGEEALDGAIAACAYLEADDYLVGFVLLDLNTGIGLAYHADSEFYSASSIKGPYVAADVATYPEDFGPYEYSIEAILVNSDNGAYEDFYLRRYDEPLDAWYDQAGVDLVGNNPMYPYYSARQLTHLWVDTYGFLSSDAEHASELAEYYSYPVNSAVHSQLDWRGTTWSKAGWYATYEYADTYSTSPTSCDAGIVLVENHPYLIVMMSDYPGNVAMLYDLANALDAVHQDICLFVDGAAATE